MATPHHHIALDDYVLLKTGQIAPHALNTLRLSGICLSSMNLIIDFVSSRLNQWVHVLNRQIILVTW